MNSIKTDYKEFNDPFIVSMYDHQNQHYPEEKQFYFDFVDEIKAKKILDIGCGTGLLTVSLANEGYDVVGIDPFQAMIDNAKQKTGSEKVRWIVGDALDLENENADLSLMTVHVVQHLINDDYFYRCLKSINESLKTGGYLVFDTRNSNAVNAGANWPTKDNPKENYDPVHGNMLSWVNIIKIEGDVLLYQVNNNILSSGQTLTSTNELIFRSQKEITQFLIKAGFEVEKVYGNFDKSHLTSLSPEMIFVARKVI